MDGWMDGRVDGWMNREVMDRWINGWMEGQMEGWMNG